MKLQESLPNTLQLTTENVMKNTVKIKNAFPTLPVEFYDILFERLRAKGFSDEKLDDAVNRVIDTCKYPTPTVAHFMSYDEDHSCPYGFTFGKDHESFAGCENCEDYNQKIWFRCKAYRAKKA